MTAARLKEVVEIVAVISIVASLIFVGMQLRQDKEIAAAQVFVESDGLVFELSQMVNENRDVWIRGLNGEELSELDEVTFESIAVAVYQRHRGIASRVTRLDTGIAGNRAKHYAYILYQHPGLRRVFMSRVKFDEMRYAANSSISNPVKDRVKFDHHVLESLAELDKVAPPISEKTYTPF
jgi:hypothetical protein